LNRPAVGQIHAVLANDVESASNVSVPTLVDVPAGADVLLADDVESASELSSPAVAQVHVLLADDVESASAVSAPSVGVPLRRKGLGSRKRKRLYVKNGRIVDEREFYTPNVALPEPIAATLEAQSKAQPTVFRKKLKLKRKKLNKEPELTDEDIVAIMAIMSAA
jgi:hypothetical protein